MGTDTSGTEKQKKRAEENKKILKKADRKRLAEFNDPDNVAGREWLKAAFKNDIDQIAHFAEGLMTEVEEIHKKNEELVEKLNRIYRIGSGLSNESKAEPHVKYNMARMSLERDPRDPVARAFISAMQAGRRADRV